MGVPVSPDRPRHDSAVRHVLRVRVLSPALAALDLRIGDLVVVDSAAPSLAARVCVLRDLGVQAHPALLDALVGQHLTPVTECAGRPAALPPSIVARQRALSALVSLATSATPAPPTQSG